jgi:hypothetical protein
MLFLEERTLGTQKGMHRRVVWDKKNGESMLAWPHVVVCPWFDGNKFMGLAGNWDAVLIMWAVEIGLATSGGQMKCIVRAKVQNACKKGYTEDSK